jgi:hypothetical protein
MERLLRNGGCSSINFVLYSGLTIACECARTAGPECCARSALAAVVLDKDADAAATRRIAAPIAGSVGRVDDLDPFGDRCSVSVGLGRVNLARDRSERRLWSGSFRPTATRPASFGTPQF